MSIIILKKSTQSAAGDFFQKLKLQNQTKCMFCTIMWYRTTKFSSIQKSWPPLTEGPVFQGGATIPQGARAPLAPPGYGPAALPEHLRDRYIHMGFTLSNLRPAQCSTIQELQMFQDKMPMGPT